MARPVATYSIVACDLEAGQWGVAVQSKFLAVGSVVPWAEPGAGAVATQSYANPRYGPDGLALLRKGSVRTGRRRRADPRRRGARPAPGRCRRRAAEPRRPSPEAAATTGRAGAPGRATRRRGTSSSPARRSTRSPRRSSRRAGRSRNGCWRRSQQLRRPAATGAASSPPRCSSSSATAGTQGSRTSSSTCASTTTNGRSRSCGGCYELHDLLFGRTPREQWLTVDEALRAELDERLAAAGYQRLEDWAGVANLEERVDGEEAIDPVVLRELRRAT